MSNLSISADRADDGEDDVDALLGNDSDADSTDDDLAIATGDDDDDGNDDDDDAGSDSAAPESDHD